MQNKTRNILLMSAISVLAAAAIPHADAAIYMKIGDIEGESTDDKHIGWIELDSFKCGVDNTTKKKSGERRGTADINIGVGELQECTISKSTDSASAQLAQFAINGNSLGTAEIDFVEVAGGSESGEPITYLKYKLDRVFIKSWSTSGDADDRPTKEVAFYYNKIGFAYTPQGEDRPTPSNIMS